MSVDVERNEREVCREHDSLRGYFRWLDLYLVTCLLEWVDLALSALVDLECLE